MPDRINVMNSASVQLPMPVAASGEMFGGWVPTMGKNRRVLPVTGAHTIEGGGAIPPSAFSHTVDLSGHTGRITVLAVWNIGDTVNIAARLEALTRILEAEPPTLSLFDGET